MIDQIDQDAASACDWLHFVARSGEAGRAWAADFSRHLPVLKIGEGALSRLRGRRLEEGRQVLEEFAAAVAATGGAPASVRHVLDRWLHGVTAYFWYCVDELDQAACSLRRAHEAVVDAVSTAGFLMPLALDCQEFILHEARVARNRRRWPEMRRSIERARGMVLDQTPLCELRDGRPVFFASLSAFYRSLEPLAPAERQAVHGLLDTEERMRLFEGFVRRLLRLPDFAISYP